MGRSASGFSSTTCCVTRVSAPWWFLGFAILSTTFGGWSGIRETPKTSPRGSHTWNSRQLGRHWLRQTRWSTGVLGDVPCPCQKDEILICEEGQLPLRTASPSG
ncbi:uncharacterized protein LOC144306533 isoform X5 [Canis aureus]